MKNPFPSIHRSHYKPSTHWKVKGYREQAWPGPSSREALSLPRAVRLFGDLVYERDLVEVRIEALGELPGHPPVRGRLGVREHRLEVLVAPLSDVSTRPVSDDDIGRQGATRRNLAEVAEWFQPDLR